MTCSNCFSVHGCACKARVASDSKTVCTNCLMKYEAALNGKATPIRVVNLMPLGTAPGNVNLTYTQSN